MTERIRERLYSALDVEEDATEEEIRRAYLRLARELHPDLTGGDRRKTERLKLVTAAYRVVGDKGRRAEYDKIRKSPVMERGSIFGSKFDDLVAAVSSEGIHAGNASSLLDDLFATARDLMEETPARLKDAVSSPSSFADFLEQLLDCEISVGGRKARKDAPPGGGGKR
jgi:curved DNA-binding protein CbpA